MDICVILLCSFFFCPAFSPLFDFLTELTIIRLRSLADPNMYHLQSQIPKTWEISQLFFFLIYIYMYNLNPTIQIPMVSLLYYATF